MLALETPRHSAVVEASLNKLGFSFPQQEQMCVHVLLARSAGKEYKHILLGFAPQSKKQWKCVCVCVCLHGGIEWKGGDGKHRDHVPEDLESSNNPLIFSMAAIFLPRQGQLGRLVLWLHRLSCHLQSQHPVVPWIGSNSSHNALLV